MSMLNPVGEGEVDKVAERTRKRAEEEGKSAAQVLMKLLEPHITSGILPAELAMALDQAEQQRIIEIYTAERNAGKHNDRRSIGRGLIALVLQETRERIEILLDENDMLIEGSLLVSFEPSEGNPDLLYMNLPQGGYATSDEPVVTFYPNPEQVNEAMGIVGDPGIRWVLDDILIVRIEGNAGELWQSPSYTPDGAMIVED